MATYINEHSWLHSHTHVRPLHELDENRHQCVKNIHSSWGQTWYPVLHTVFILVWIHVYNTGYHILVLSSWGQTWYPVLYTVFILVWIHVYNTGYHILVLSSWGHTHGTLCYILRLYLYEYMYITPVTISSYLAVEVTHMVPCVIYCVYTCMNTCI